MRIKKCILIFISILLILSFIFVLISCMLFSNNYLEHCCLNIRIRDSYSIWNPKMMKLLIQERTFSKYNLYNADSLLSRSYQSMYIEWWFHNIGYYITKPFCFNDFINEINLRFKNVDINELIH